MYRHDHINNISQVKQNREQKNNDNQKLPFRLVAFDFQNSTSADGPGST